MVMFQSCLCFVRWAADAATGWR